MLRHCSVMINQGEMFQFSSKLYFEKRRINKEDGYTTLFLQVVISRRHKEFSLKLRWPVTKIDMINSVLLSRYKNDVDVADYNMLIMTERAKHNEIFKIYRLRNEFIDLDKFTRELRVYDSKESFITYQRLENARRLRKKEICNKTFQNHEATCKQVEIYDPLSLFQNIDAKWMLGFKNFLINKYYKHSTIWARLKEVQTTLNLAAAEPMIYVHKSAIEFKNAKPKTETTFLNRDEITRMILIHDPLFLTPIEFNVLSAFLFTCFTSIRISDVYRIDHSWEISENFIKFKPHKNRKSGKVIEIPIMSIAKSFINNIKGKYFTLPCEQEYNRTLKDLAVKAEINKKITSHVGRHTFGYLFMTTVGNLKSLMEILGHSKIDTTDRYAHLDNEYQLDAVKQIEKSFTNFRVLRKIS